MDQLAYLKPSKRNRQKRRDKCLSEELIECRRYGGGDSNKKCREKSQSKFIQNDLRSETPRFRSSYKDKRDGVSFSDNLEPLIRLLRSHVGQPWDKVYAKLCQQLDKRSTLGIHVFDHLLDFVDIHAIIEDGKVVIINRYGKHNYGLHYIYRWPRFYVHPKTGLLSLLKKESPKGPYPKKARWKKAKAKLKSKIRQGIQTNKRPRYHFENIRTYGKYLSPGAIYDVKINDPNQESRCRVKLLKLTSSKNGLKLTVSVLKSSLLQKEGKIILNNKTIDTSYHYYRDTQRQYFDWKIFDTGTFSFHTKQQKKNKKFFAAWY